ncbi:MAG: iron chelate uptake ABC transporter family permease subunit [Streptosporangiales bacterium]|nr:iron chelate uptake ABC transporter family permease subunit [Streptosporangiales bacterium]
MTGSTRSRTICGSWGSGIWPPARSSRISTRSSSRTSGCRATRRDGEVSAAERAGAGLAGYGRLPLPGLLLALLGGLALAAAVVASISLGTVFIAPETIVAAFTSFDGSDQQVIVLTVRLPRAMIAAAVGATLGMAGAVMQAVSRNPLAEPGILGISWGAALAAVGAQVLLGVGSLTGLVWCALVGAAAAGAAVVMLGALGRRGLTPAKLVVAGAAVSALLAAVVQGLLVLDRESLEGARRWLAGSIVGTNETLLLQVLPYQLAGILLALLLARPLTTFSLGEDVARGLGQRTGFVKGGAAAAVVLLAGSAVAAAGPVILVGLAVPHLSRFLFGRDYRRVLPAAAVLGALLVVVADVAARFVIPPEEVPVGVMTALVGGPYFVHVVRRGMAPL